MTCHRSATPGYEGEGDMRKEECQRNGGALQDATGIVTSLSPGRSNPPATSHVPGKSPAGFRHSTMTASSLIYLTGH